LASALLWALVFSGIILRKRPIKSGKAYELIWNKDLNESPLKTLTRAQSEKVAEGENTTVIPCLNDSPRSLNQLTDLISENL